jgi:thiamine biosynthesis protein ThiS
MEITFNGKQRELPGSISIQELLDQLKLDCQQVVVEHNQKIIPRQRLDGTMLNDGDTLEVIHFVGGG